MAEKSLPDHPDAYWDRAGELGYAEAMFSSGVVGEHITRRCWNLAIEIADAIGVPAVSHVLDFGCGDGAFTNTVLAARYRASDGLDKSEAAIARARANAPGGHLRYEAADLVSLDYNALPRYDAAFLIGILHHVKSATPRVVQSLRSVTNRMIVLEPNGDNLVRKLLEWTPSYRAAGEDSFGTQQVIDIFAQAGFAPKVQRRLNLFPNFTPTWIYRTFAPLEQRIEASSFWNALCTVNMFGFVATE